MRRIPFLLLLLLLPAALRAQRDSLGALERAEHVAAVEAFLSERFYGHSPVGELYRPTLSLSRLEVRMQLRREEEARLEPLGDGALEGASGPKATGGSIRRASSGPMPTMCGATATTSAGTPRPTICCCIPTSRPIRSAATSRPRSMPSAADMRAASGRFAVALRGDYRAGQEYRQVDPRPHNVVSDFTLRFGGGIEWQRHTLLADFAWRLYKQNQRISFQNETNIVRELFMTGLGSYLPRYSGKSSSTTVAYEGRGYGAALQFMPRTGTGWYARPPGNASPPTATTVRTTRSR